MGNGSEKTRVVVAGIGGRGVWTANKLRDDARYEIVALCDRNRGKLDAVRKNEGFAAVAGYESIVACIRETDPEAVVVTTHDGSHAEMVLPALEAGKFVFVEKPLEVTEEKCRDIVEADRKAGGKTFVGFNLRFAPVYVKVKELIDRGVVGDVLTIQADEYYDGGRTYFRRWNRLRAFGGGLWITKASHDFDILYWLAGRKPVSVYANAELSYYKSRDDVPLYCADCHEKESCPDSFYKMDRGRRIDGKLLSEIAAEHGDPRPDLCLYNSDKDTFDHGIATVAFEGDILATYTCNVVAGFTERRIRVSGTKGTVDGTLGADKLTLRLRDPSRTEDVPLHASKGGHGGADDFIFADFHEFTRGRREPKVRPDEAMVAVLLGLAATRSGDEKRRVEMSEFGM